MRVRELNGATSVHAIAGTNVVLFGMDVERRATKGLLGFAIERRRDDRWEPLRNFILFERNDVGEGADDSSVANPFQAFVWGDYTLGPDATYRYRVTPMHGEPGGLEPGDQVEVEVRTESERSGRHAVYFNRGPAAAQRYATKFDNRNPHDVGEEAWTWLSRGLREGLLEFLGQARGSRFGLRAAVYEFTYPRVLQAFREAKESGADVRIVCDQIPNANRDPLERNLKAVGDAGIDGLVTGRTLGVRISHNKFVVLLEDGRPRAVWTGSTNVTEGGIFGHLNVGHVVRDDDVAARYLAYWEELHGDPPLPAMKEFNERTSPVPAGSPETGAVETIFIPHADLRALDRYAALMDRARNSVFLTAAFGVSEELRRVFEEDKPYLRYLLLERTDSKIATINRDPENRVAAGAFIGSGGWRQWQVENLSRLGLNEHVRFIHTKIMLIDPLTDDSIVITGSANFSKASTTANDENMLVIRGDARVADIYLTEFMRTFTAFHFRGKAGVTGSRSAPAPGERALRAPRHLHLDESDEWAKPFFQRGSPKQKERLLFR